MLSFIYADLKKDDPRVSAALEWLGKNYTLDENPGMGRAGLYYYYHLAAKGLATAKIAEIETPDGKKVKWPREMALKLMNLQKPDGSWINDTPRWMETDPVLVTTYGSVDTWRFSTTSFKSRRPSPSSVAARRNPFALIFATAGRIARVTIRRAPAATSRRPRA